MCNKKDLPDINQYNHQVNYVKDQEIDLDNASRNEPIKSKDNQPKDKMVNQKDRGFSWVIVAASFISHFIGVFGYG